MKIGLKSVLFDTNLLVYLYIKGSSKANVLKNLVNQWSKGDLEIFIAEQSLLEFYSVVTNARRVKKPASYKIAQKDIKEYYQSKTFKIICPNISTFSLFLKIISNRRIKGPDIFDFYLAATALSNGVDVIYTENENDFKNIKGLKVINPFN